MEAMVSIHLHSPNELASWDGTSLVEYADLVVESGPPDKVTRLQKLQDKAIRIVDDGRHSKSGSGRDSILSSWS